MWIEALALVILLLLELAALVMMLGISRQHAAATRALEAAAARSAEQELRLQALDDLRENRDLAEQFFGSSSRVIRNLRRGFSDIPDNIPDAARAAVDLHKNISGDISDAASTLGKAFRLHARKTIDGITDPDDTRQR